MIILKQTPVKRKTILNIVFEEEGGRGLSYQGIHDEKSAVPLFSYCFNILSYLKKKIIISFKITIKKNLVYLFESSKMCNYAPL